MTSLVSESRSLKKTRTLMMCACAGLLGWGSMAQAQESPDTLPRCTEQNLVGPYAASRSGVLVGRGDIAANGIVNFDGQGNLSGKDTASVGGKVTVQDYKGSYSVNPDCTGEATLFFADGERVSLAIQVLGDKQQIRFIQTDEGTVVNGSAIAQWDLRRLSSPVAGRAGETRELSKAQSSRIRPGDVVSGSPISIGYPGDDFQFEFKHHIPPEILQYCANNTDPKATSADCYASYCRAQGEGSVGSDEKGLYCESKGQ